MAKKHPLIHRPEDISRHAPLRLKVAAALLSPDGSMTGETLLRYVRDGRLLTEAFNAGREAGREEAKSVVLASIHNLTADAHVLRGSTSAGVLTHIKESEGRAAPGTVKPAVRNFISSRHDGVTIDEIIAGTGVKPNSVRGTLYSLQEDGDIERRGEKWFPATKQPDELEMLK